MVAPAGSPLSPAPAASVWYPARMLHIGTRSTFLAAFGASLLTATLLSAQGPATTTTPGPILLTVLGRGVQVYRCDGASAPPAWVLDHPDADLFNAQGKVVGHHDAGPSWQLEDGSSVQGALIEKTPAPGPSDIPWLLLHASAHQGTGLLASAETIRRTQTHGGLAPRQGCDPSMVGATVNVPYTATYSFYGRK